MSCLVLQLSWFQILSSAIGYTSNLHRWYISEEDSWPTNKDKLIKRHYKAFAKFTQQLDKIKEMNT